MLLSLLRVKLCTTAASSLLLALLQMIIDYSLSPLASEFVPSSSLPKPERESSPQKANASLSINSPRSPPPERTSSSSEAPETEKPKDSSASTPVKRVPTPPPESEPREENGKELEEEDENDDRHYLNLSIISYCYYFLPHKKINKCEINSIGKYHIFLDEALFCNLNRSVSSIHYFKVYSFDFLINLEIVSSILYAILSWFLSNSIILCFNFLFSTRRDSDG